jgi:hypothetical protein
MKERPILFSGEMVRAILGNRKTQTRRVVKLNPDDPMSGAPRSFRAYEILDGKHQGRFGFDNEDGEYVCPYGEPGDRLWVRETFNLLAINVNGTDYNPENYRATRTLPDPVGGWRPSIHMPRWASRITLVVTDVRVERVRTISEDDAIAEGLLHDSCGWYVPGNPNIGSPTAKMAFGQLWHNINAKRGFGWDVNPWVWVIEFRRVKR